MSKAYYSYLIKCNYIKRFFKTWMRARDHEKLYITETRHFIWSRYYRAIQCIIYSKLCTICKLVSIENTQNYANNDRFVINITCEDILRTLSSTRPSSSGPDGITGDMVAKLTTILTRRFFIIYQQLMLQGKFPSM